MNEPLDLFPDTVPPADPLVGKAVSIAPVCWRCGANVALINPGRGPHAAELRCHNCDAHRQWLSRADYHEIAKFLAEIGNQFGAPSEIIYRLPPSNRSENEMADDTKYDNSGILFRNTNKNGERDRDYKGDATIAGVKYWFSGWLKEAKNGTKFLTFSFKPKDAPATQQAADADDDDTSFGARRST
jgi:hypothetical protein